MFLIEVAALHERLGNPNLRIVDCRFSIADTEAGRAAYLEGHLPGAVYAHLDDHLSSPIVPGQTGRHPLPTAEAFAAQLGRWGIDRQSEVVVYDDRGGAIAGRLWWMLRWLGHDQVRLLNGGIQAWSAINGPLDAGAAQPKEAVFKPGSRDDLLKSLEDIIDFDFQEGVLFDARAANRFRGEGETLDPVGGHIPGAVSLPFADNLDDSGYFLDREALRARFEKALAGKEPSKAVVYCGSGVTAAHNILALHEAGFGDVPLFVGSWSQWIADSSRPVATGDD